MNYNVTYLSGDTPRTRTMSADELSEFRARHEVVEAIPVPATQPAKPFPELAPTVWRSQHSYVVTLTDGCRLPAYPVRGLISESFFYFGEACKDQTWLIIDMFAEHPFIQEVSGRRIVATDHVIDWDELSPVTVGAA